MAALCRPCVLLGLCTCLAYLGTVQMLIRIDACLEEALSDC